MKTIRIFAAAILASLLALSPAAADIYLWSQTPASNSNSDLSDDINLVEGMAPSEVNDSIRALMAEVKKWVDDQGAVKPTTTLMTTAGSANAQTLSTNGAASTLKHGWHVCFIVGGGLTNTGATTLNVDSLGAKNVQGIDGTALAGGELAAGTFHCATYDINDTVWLLDTFQPVDATSITYTSTGKLQRAALTGDVTASAGSNAMSIANDAVTRDKIANAVGTIPVGAVYDYAGTSCPSLSLEPYGQSLVRADYADLFTAIGTTYGAVDGTHFSLPDLRGRVVIAEDDLGGSSADNITTTLDGDTLGATGGEERHTMTSGELVSHAHSAGSFVAASHTHGAGTYTVSTSITNGTLVVRNASTFTASDGSGHSNTPTGVSQQTLSLTNGDVSGSSGSSGSLSVSGTSNSAGSTTPFNVLQPSIVLHKCIYAGV